MTYTDWREPVRLLRALTGPPTEELLRAAGALDCPHESEPHGVLRAIVEDWLRPVLYEEVPPLVTEKQLAYLERLGHVGAGESMSRSVASAWIGHYLALNSVHALQHLELMSGDHVYFVGGQLDFDRHASFGIEETLTVSSIGSSGMVYFRGGNGRCAWPANLRIARKS